MIRRAASGDVLALRAMMVGSNGYGRPEERAMIQAFAAGWTGDGEEVCVLEDEAGLAGFYALVDGAEGWELDLFFTANDRQGRGVGAALFAHMMARAAALGASSVLICSNPSAADFYRRMGAVDAGVTPPSPTIPWSRPRFRVAV